MRHNMGLCLIAGGRGGRGSVTSFFLGRGLGQCLEKSEHVCRNAWDVFDGNNHFYGCDKCLTTYLTISRNA